MTTFIPEWTKVSGTLSKVRQELASLDDDHVVRRPLKPCQAATFFVEHRGKGWLSVLVSDLKFTDIDSAQMFEHKSQSDWEAVLDNAGVVPNGDEPSARIAALIIMWACTTDEVKQLAKSALREHGIRLVSRQQYEQLGSKLVHGLLTPVAEKQAKLVMAAYFPEAEIVVSCAAKRRFNRDNNAQLDRLFLDHHQEWATKLDIEMPEEQALIASDKNVRIVNGVPGSGKTLIAVNRALMLCEMHPEQRVLILIHNTPIVADISARLERALGALPKNLEIATFYSWVFRQWRAEYAAIPNMVSEDEVIALISNFLPNVVGLGLSTKQLNEEIDFIHESMLTELDAYLNVDRTGRGFGLRSKGREQVWQVFCHVKEKLSQRRRKLWSELPPTICLSATSAANRLHKYDHILVDEAQFFAPSWFELVKLSRTHGGHLFLCADPNQGFMRARLSWKRVGLDVAGRTKKLHKSYRTTQSILKAAQGILDSLGLPESDDYVKPDFSGMDAGETPILVCSDSPRDSTIRLVNEIKSALANGVPLSAMLIVCGDGIQRSALREALAQQFDFDAIWWFNDPSQKKRPPGKSNRDYLRMAYIDTATGLEGSLVFLIGIDGLLSNSLMPGETSEEFDQRKEEQGRKLYMAMTRASQQLVLMASEPPPLGVSQYFQQP
jgi:hypothetical protein